MAKKGPSLRKDKNISKSKQRQERIDKKSQKKEKKLRKAVLTTNNSFSTGQPDKYVN